MAMGKRKTERQQELWVATADIPQAPGHPFYRKLNELLAKDGFDPFVEGLCQKFYHEEIGRPGVPPGVYFRMLLVGYFEGIDSERGIAWRCDDSRTLRDFLGYSMTQGTPDHSSLSRIRGRIDLESHQEVFSWVLKMLASKGLLKGKTLGIDATTLEANAAMRSIVRNDTGQTYNEFLTQLAQASGIATPTREDLAKIDRKRKNKASNDDWHNPNDPDAKITKMKDGRTHLAHKAEHAVDLETGAIVAVTLQEADKGDTTTLWTTIAESGENLRDVTDDPRTADCIDGQIIAEVVADKGYHSNDTCRELAEVEIRSYVSEPARKGRRDWQDKSVERDAVYANRRRVRDQRGKRLLRRRGELLERPFAHCYETGGMRRTHLQTHRKILKRLLVHVAAFNLGLVMRSIFGIGKPRRLQDGFSLAHSGVFDTILSLLGRLRSAYARLSGLRLLWGRWESKTLACAAA
jgi:transposase